MIDGNWTLISGEQEGQEIVGDALSQSKLEIADHNHHVRVGGAEMIGTHTLDANASPMTIDAIDTEGPYQGQEMRGIFKVEGDIFTVCFAPPGADRPVDFTTQDGKAAILHHWKRA